MPEKMFSGFEMLRMHVFVLLPSDGWDNKGVHLRVAVDEDAAHVRSSVSISELHPTSSDTSPSWEDKDDKEKMIDCDIIYTYNPTLPPHNPPEPIHNDHTAACSEVIHMDQCTYNDSQGREINLFSE